MRFLVLPAAIAALSLISACDRAPLEPAAPASDQAPGKPATGVRLDAAARGKLGVVTAPLVAMRAAARIDAVGQVLAFEPLGQLDADLRAARAADVASAAALARATALNADDNGVSGQVVEAAQRQASIDHAQLTLFRRRLAAGWGSPSPLEADDARQGWLERLSAGQAALLRLDFPAGTNVQPTARGVRIEPLDVRGEALAARELWPSPIAGPHPGPSFLALLEGRSGLRPGDRVRARAASTAVRAGVVVPAAAIIAYAGQTWCFVARGGDAFERRPVSLEQPVDGGYFATGGLAAGEQVVVQSAGLVLAAETGAGSAGADD